MTEIIEEVKTSPAKAKGTAKKSAKKVKAPLIINGRYVATKKFEAKPKKGSKPYALSKKKIKVTLIKSTSGSLIRHQKTVQALGLTKIGTFKVHADNDAIRGMIQVVNHLVKVEEVK